VFIVYKNDDIDSLLAGIFWLKEFKPFEFSDGKKCLKRFRELDENADAVIVGHE
jgi:hypothetical protein